MAQSYVISGATIKLYLNNKVYKVTQGVSFTVDYGEAGIYGIDAAYPQEIASNRVTVTGSVQGLRLKYSGGLQAAAGRPLFTEIAASPYISIRIQDRSTQEDIIFIPNAKISRESHSMAAKGVYRLNFDFIGQIPLMALDRA